MVAISVAKTKTITVVTITVSWVSAVQVHFSIELVCLVVEELNLLESSYLNEVRDEIGPLFILVEATSKLRNFNEILKQRERMSPKKF